MKQVIRVDLAAVGGEYLVPDGWELLSTQILSVPVAQYMSTQGVSYMQQVYHVIRLTG